MTHLIRNPRTLSVMLCVSATGLILIVAWFVHTAHTPQVQALYLAHRDGEAGVHLIGRVLDESGSPVSGAVVEATIRRVRWAFQFSGEGQLGGLEESVIVTAESDSRGEFRFEGRGGTLRITRVSKPGFVWRKVNSSAGDDFHFFAVGRGARCFASAERPALFALHKAGTVMPAKLSRGGSERLADGRIVEHPVRLVEWWRDGTENSEKP